MAREGFPVSFTACGVDEPHRALVVTNRGSVPSGLYATAVACDIGEG